MACAVEKATDWDYWTMGNQSGYEADTVSYTWSYSGPDMTSGSFTPANVDTAQDPPDDPNRTPTWTAPTTPGTYTLTCTIDDAPAAVGDGETGSRDDDPVVRSVTVVVAPAPKVSFSGLINGTVRACAGGLDDHLVADPAHYRVHTVDLTAQVTQDGQPLANTPILFSFKGNAGHDYGDGREKKTARLYDAANNLWPESLTLTTDANGNVSLTVLSSDVISQPTLQASWTDAQNNSVVIGNVKCDFAAAKGKRGFANQYNPEEPYPGGDDGWLFNRLWLSAPSVETTAKVYLQFKVDPSLGDTPDNWKRVNDHRVLFEIESIDLQDGVAAGTPSDFAIIVPNTDGTTAFVTRFDGDLGGAATAIVSAGSRISDAKVIWLKATDQMQWQN